VIDLKMHGENMKLMNKIFICITASSQ